MRTWRAKAEIRRFGKKLYAGRYLVANEGNLSLRLDDQNILITKTQVCKGELTRRDLVTIKLTNPAEASLQASSEYRMHLAIYQQHPNIKAVIHTHPPFTIACAITAAAIDQPILPEMILTEPQIAVVPYLAPSSSELAERVAQALDASRTVLLQNHGLVTVGETLQEAFWRTERCEHLCKIWLLGHLSGQVNVLTPEQVAALKGLFLNRSAASSIRGQ